ncbi:MAG: gluconate 2-dehydrogenase subunit 3 family protein [Acidobacteriota bacterium]
MRRQGMSGRTRREVLAAMAVGAPALQAQHGHETGPVQITGPYRPKALTPAEMQWLAHLADAIIPRTETPGASDAGVPAFIDRRAAANAALAAQLREGMKLLDVESVKRFQVGATALDAAGVTALLTPLEGARDTDLGVFFQLLKDLTVEGYYTSREGLVQELGWHGNTYLTQFEGCTHPEHQA